MKIQTKSRNESWHSSTKDTGCNYQEKSGRTVLRSIVIAYSCFDCPLTVCKMEPDGGHAALNVWKVSQGLPMKKKKEA
jgi:hypothetical protein